MGDEKQVSADEVIRFFKMEAPSIHLSVDSLLIPENVVEIYRFFVQSLTLCKDEVLGQITAEDQEQLRRSVEDYEFRYFKELHENSFPLMKLLLSIDYIFEKLGYKQHVTIKDLTNPTKKRLLGNITILIRFFMFVKSRKFIVNNVLEKSKEIQDEKALLVKRNNELKERINHIRMEKAKQEPALKQVKQRQSDLIGRLKEKKSNAANIKREEGQLAEENKLLQAALTEKKLAKDSLESKENLLSSQMVSSPEKLSADMIALKKQAAEKETYLEALSGEISHLVERRNDLPRVEILLDTMLTSLDQISEEIAKKDDLVKKHENLCDQIRALNLRLKDLRLSRTGNLEQLSARRDQLNKFEQQQKIRTSDVKKEISTLKEQIARLEREIKENEVVSSNCDEEARAIRKEIMIMERDHEKTLGMFNEKEEKLIMALDKMNKDESESNTSYIKQIVNGDDSSDGDEGEIDR